MPRISGERPAETAVALMRSRYTAYVTQNIDHVVASHQKAGRGDVDRDAAMEWAKGAEWVGLEIVDSEAGGANDDTGIVEFIARFRVDGAEQMHHERSRFVREEGQWFYVDGDMVRAKPVRRDEPKVGRNEPCPCGSGKKFKKCCG